MKHHPNNLAASSMQTSLVFITVLATVSMTAQTQTYTVNGVVATSTRSARYASVTFVDNADTTKKVSVLTDTSGRYSVDVITSVKLTDTQPAEFELEQDYPNPFASSTAISYKLNTPADVKVTIYDILGREIRKFAMGDQAVGAHGIVWDGKNDMGEIVSRGTYFCQLQAKGETRIKKMIFGVGGNSVVVSPPNIQTPKALEMKNGMIVALLGGNFNVRIENTDSTFPAIIAQQFDNVTVQGNTTLDFTVSTSGTFPDPNAALIYARCVT